MAGSINLSLSQQFDKTTGKLLSGGRLQFYQAGTTNTPQSAYQDTALTLAHPNPIVLASDGRVPAFYLADGQIRVRLTNSAGIVQFDQDNLLVIGPSSGSGGGGGGSVDATTVFKTGDTMWQDSSGVRTGWVRDNGRTIGSATSGASERANSDCENLFNFLWQTYSDTLCPVGGGRGVSSAADWSANKTITLPDKRGYVPGGLDDMGNSAAGRLASAPVTKGSVTTAGSLIGESAHAQTASELAAHIHGVTDAGHTHAIHGTFYATTAGPANAAQGTGTWGAAAPTLLGSTDSATTGVTVNSTGSGAAANVIQRTVLGTFYRKL